MEKYGGGFIKALANLARHADVHNLVIIKLNWAGYWTEYEEMGRRLEAESEKTQTP